MGRKSHQSCEVKIGGCTSKSSLWIPLRHVSLWPSVRDQKDSSLGRVQKNDTTANRCTCNDDDELPIQRSHVERLCFVSLVVGWTVPRSRWAVSFDCRPVDRGRTISCLQFSRNGQVLLKAATTRQSSSSQVRGVSFVRRRLSRRPLLIEESKNGVVLVCSHR